MLELRPYEDLAAVAVLRALDWHDQTEAELIRGAATTGLALFADWRAMLAAHVISQVAHWQGLPFAVFALANTGQAGVAQAALLARDHARHRRALGALGAAIRAALPAEAAARGIHRIEARCWANHPTASRFLTAIGFHLDCDMPGFGRSGAITFRQFAWTCPTIPPATES